MERHGSVSDPYRIFFPLGIALGAIGVSIWPLYYYGFAEGYSGRAHAFVQIDGFLYSFIAGFLLTAIPRFTGTEAPSTPSQYLLAAVIAFSALAADFQYFAVGLTGFLVAHAILVALLLPRFVRRQQDPPATFALVGIGILSGVFAAGMNAAISWGVIAPSWDLLGKRLLTEGMVLLLVLGIGGFLGPRLLGFAQLPQFVNVGNPIAAPKQKHLLYAIAGLGLCLSLIGEYGLGYSWMSYLRAALVSAVIFSTVQPWRLPLVRTTVAWSVWIAHWLIISAVWLVAVAPRYRIDLLHILFIGGFTLLIFAVGTRVSLSHGGHTLAAERRSWPLRIGLTSGLIAMLARVGAPFAGPLYFAHLAWAGILWITGILFWGIYLVRLIYRRGGP
jgi:uncharacterized protein involved in response to NO